MSLSALPLGRWEAILRSWRRIPCLVSGHRWVSQQYVDAHWHEYRRCRACGRIER